MPCSWARSKWTKCPAVRISPEIFFRNFHGVLDVCLEKSSASRNYFSFFCDEFPELVHTVTIKSLGHSENLAILQYKQAWKIHPLKNSKEIFEIA